MTSMIATPESGFRYPEHPLLQHARTVSDDPSGFENQLAETDTKSLPYWVLQDAIEHLDEDDPQLATAREQILLLLAASPNCPAHPSSD